MISFKNFRSEINEAVDISGMSIDQLRKKFRRSIADYKKDGFFKNDKIEAMFMQWGMSNGEIRTDDYAEFEDMMDRIVNEDTSIKEAFTPKEIKMATGIASDPRYKGGNYSGAVRAIEKIKKGLANHPQVAAVLKRQNEDISEDGHRDVKSAMNQVKIAVSALNKMNTELGKLNAEDPLPTWWTNKVAIAVDNLDSMADYLDTQVEDKFEPHMMYDPKTGKGYKANTMDDHLRMKKLGYTHESK